MLAAIDGEYDLSHQKDILGVLESIKYDYRRGPRDWINIVDFSMKALDPPLKNYVEDYNLNLKP